MNNNTTANVLCTKYKVSAFDDILRRLTHYCAPTNEMKSQVSAEEDILHSGIVLARKVRTKERASEEELI